MTENADDGNETTGHESGDHESAFHEPTVPFVTADTEMLLGGFSVVSPGVEIVLDGRAISAPAID